MNRPKNRDLHGRPDGGIHPLPTNLQLRSDSTPDTASESIPSLFHEKLAIIYANIRL